MIILTKTAKTGQTITVSLRGTTLEVALDGKTVASGSLQELATPRGDVTHHLGGKVGFTAAEAETLRAAQRAASPPSPAEQRRLLAARPGGLQDERLAAYERGHASDGSAAHAAAGRWDAEIEAARQALAEFDAAHPEVLAAIRAEKSEIAARHAWD